MAMLRPRAKIHSVLEGRKSTRTEENVSHGITKKILGKNREFQTAGRRWVSDRCWHCGSEFGTNSN
jgi:hypothetical protein